MKEKIFIGIDGGGSKTKIRVEHDSGELIGQAVSGPANIGLSVSKTWDSILQGIEEALSDCSIQLKDTRYSFNVGMGLAGLEIHHAKQEFLNHVHTFDSLYLTSDAHAACLGAHEGRDGAIIVMGTGAVAYQIENNHSTKISGWGFPHDDEGSGAWLGLEAVRLTFQWLDNRTEKSPLAEEVFAFFNHDLQQLVHWAHRANSTEFARLAPLVINHSQQEEAGAVRLMKKAAHAAEKMHAALVKQQKNKTTPLSLCLFGGIAPFLQPWLPEELQSRLIPRSGDAAQGAILFARREGAV